MPRLWTILLAAAALAQDGGGTIDFDLRSFPESPVVYATAANQAAPGVPRRQFVTIRNESKKGVAGVIFEQSVAVGAKTAIVAIEHVGILFAAGEKRRVSVAVEDMAQKQQSGETTGRPVMSIVAVEYLDGSQWSAPTGIPAGQK